MKSLFAFFFILMITELSFAGATPYDPLIFSFDTIEPIKIDSTLTGNCWQIGRPQKIYFDSAYSSPNVIATDSINFYPTNNVSEFVIKTPTYLGPMGGVYMQFQHKYDTDSLFDGGTIYISLDGITWDNIKNSPGVIIPYNPFPSDDTISSLNDIGFTGRSNGWEEFSFYWNYPPTDTLWLKFKFASDNIQTNKAGWMIDDLFFTFDLGIGINTIKNKTDYILSPNPFKLSTTISLSRPIHNSTLKVFNSNGQPVKTLNQINGDEIILNRNELSPGLYYFIIIEADLKIGSGEIIVE